MVVGHRIDRGAGDLWKSKARSLQLQLRERLRVAVDHHRHRPVFSGDGYFSATLNRWIQRFRSFRTDSLAYSSAFYRRRVSRDIYAEEDSAITRMLQAVAVPILGNICHVFMHGLNRVQVYGAEKLHQALLNRPTGRPLITVSNHVASMDDPLVISALLPPRVLMEAHNLRWTLCATDRCFKNPATSAFFHSVKVLPVSRGDGIYQKGLDMAISKLNNGGWVHIFPEGSRSRDGGKTMGSAKRGVGRLVLDADNIPLVVPFVHTGMQEIVPIGASLPRIGKTVTIVVGDPISFDDLLNSKGNQLSLGGANLYDAVSSRIGDRLQELKVQADKLALEQSVEERNSSLDNNTAQATRMLELVDWELLGMGSCMNSCSGTISHEEEKSTFPIQMHHQPTTVSDESIATGYGDSGLLSRIRGCLESTELTGFAARNLLFSQSKNKYATFKESNPLRHAWKQFLDANVPMQRHYAYTFQ